MHETVTLRDYQKECIRDIHSKWDAGLYRIPNVLATGLGKTVIFSQLAEDFLAATSGKRVLILAHTDELVNQAASKMKQAAPHRVVGIVKAERNETSAHVIVASVQSLRNAKRRSQLRNIGLIIVDECHHAVATTYRTILEHFGAFGVKCSECGGTGFSGDGATPNGSCWDCRGTGLYNGGEPSVKVVGFTATLARGDKKKLSEIWQTGQGDKPFTRGISFGIRRGYLLDVRGKRVIVPDFDITNVKKSAGDYADGDLARELERSLAPEVVAEAYVEEAGERKGVAFWPTVEVARLGAAAFNAAGIRSEVIHGELDTITRRAMLRRLASGETQVVHGVAVLTEGFDDPTISCIVIARPTQSAPLYQQMVGRGLRPNLALPASERGDCLVLDVVGASRNHNLRSLVDLSEKEIREEIAEDELLSLLDMESAEEALAEEELPDGAPPEELYTGATEHVDFDPLGRTTIGAWLQTTDGYYFLPAGENAYVLIVPSEEPGHWDVAWLTADAKTFFFGQCSGMEPYFSGYRQCRCGGGHQGAPGALTEHQQLSLEMACSWSEEVMESMGAGSTVGNGKAGWRKRPVSKSQAWKAQQEGVEIEEGWRQGELSDAISQVVATRRIDPVVAFMLKARGND